MIIALIGIILGIIIGFYIPYSFSMLYSIYLAVGILAAIDSILGAISATLKDRFDSIIFITGFLMNFALATILSYIGDRLGLPLYYAAIFVFGSRFFKNLAIIRRGVIEKIRKKIRK
ncbi:MAG TPA: small basic family protein [Clostridia bacterium]|jgi:small basic protein|nr:small basic family protein [Clostridia bacterium]